MENDSGVAMLELETVCEDSGETPSPSKYLAVRIGGRVLTVLKSIAETYMESMGEIGMAEHEFVRRGGILPNDR